MAVLAPHLAAAGARLKVACLKRRTGNLERELCDAGVEVLHLPEGGWRTRIVALRRLLREYRPHLVHSALFASDLTTRLASVGFPTVVISSLVSTPYDRVRFGDPRVRRWRLQVLRLLDAVTAHLWVDALHAVSEASRDSAVSALRLPPHRVAVIPRGRAVRDFQPPNAEHRAGLRRRLALDPEDEILLNVGRQVFQKGQDTLLEAFALLRRQRPRARLFVAGGVGHASADLETLQNRLGLEDEVRFLGERADVADWLAASDLFLFPSRYEGLPGALIEAMATGLPSVASDIPPIREVAAEGGIRLVPPNDPPSLAAAAGELLADPAACAELGRRGRASFLRRYRLDVCVERMIDFYASLLTAPELRRGGHG